MNICLMEEVVLDENISDIAVATYFGLRKIYNPDLKNHWVSIKALNYALTGGMTPSRGFTKSLIDGVEELNAHGLIEVIYRSPGRSDYVLDLSGLLFKSNEEFFILVAEDCFSAIHLCGCNTLKLFRYYLRVLSTISLKDGFNTLYNAETVKSTGNMAQSFFIEKLGISASSLHTYNSFLEKAELLYIYRHPKYVLSDRSFKSLPNVYGRYENKAAVIEAGQKLAASYNEKFVQKKLTTELRSLAAKFRYIQDSGKIYDEPTMEQIYLAMVEQNKKARAYYYTDDLYEQNRRDLSAFKEYDFYKGELGENETECMPADPAMRIRW